MPHARTSLPDWSSSARTARPRQSCGDAPTARRGGRHEHRARRHSSRCCRRPLPQSADLPALFAATPELQASRDFAVAACRTSRGLSPCNRHTPSLSSAGGAQGDTRQETTMGLLDVLNGMQNGPRGPSTPSSQSGGGMSPMTMAILALLAYKAVKHMTGSSTSPAAPAPAPAPAPGGSLGSGGLGGLL